MKPGKPGSADQAAQFMAEAQREQRERMRGYREQALKIYPWICARCGREFSGKKLAQLTVHHKDHNHDNNPPDGSNWELLCIYCHDDEHSRALDQDYYDPNAQSGDAPESVKFKPFAALANLLNDKKTQ